MKEQSAVTSSNSGQKWPAPYARHIWLFSLSLIALAFITSWVGLSRPNQEELQSSSWSWESSDEIFSDITDYFNTECQGYSQESYMCIQDWGFFWAETGDDSTDILYAAMENYNNGYAAYHDSENLFHQDWIVTCIPNRPTYVDTAGRRCGEIAHATGARLFTTSSDS